MVKGDFFPWKKKDQGDSEGKQVCHGSWRDIC